MSFQANDRISNGYKIAFLSLEEYTKWKIAS